jgi:hypothetical protein
MGKGASSGAPFLNSNGAIIILLVLMANKETPKLKRPQDYYQQFP